MLQELVLWSTIGALLNAVGYSWDSWQFWCFLGTYWAVGALSKRVGRVEGIVDYLEMDERDQTLIKRALDKIKEDSK